MICQVLCESQNYFMLSLIILWGINFYSILFYSWRNWVTEWCREELLHTACDVPDASQFISTKWELSFLGTKPYAVIGDSMQVKLSQVFQISWGPHNSSCVTHWKSSLIQKVFLEIHLHWEIIFHKYNPYSRLFPTHLPLLPPKRCSKGRQTKILLRKLVQTHFKNCIL